MHVYIISNFDSNLIINGYFEFRNFSYDDDIG